MNSGVLRPCSPSTVLVKAVLKSELLHPEPQGGSEWEGSCIPCGQLTGSEGELASCGAPGEPGAASRPAGSLPELQGSRGQGGVEGGGRGERKGEQGEEEGQGRGERGRACWERERESDAQRKKQEEGVPETGEGEQVRHPEKNGWWEAEKET